MAGVELPELPLWVEIRASPPETVIGRLSRKERIEGLAEARGSVSTKVRVRNVSNIVFWRLERVSASNGQAVLRNQVVGARRRRER